ncbi:hypothetical protein RRG08_019092 [Elysia crispata]|uniref:Uncharacterized protein n=1 Tax=Elysia crispata TaxID=231223 RepID=A0AAE1A772_9GAST|nr:hypothetical protein RRG08_019092 [Elysia crispata]
MPASLISGRLAGKQCTSQLNASAPVVAFVTLDTVFRYRFLIVQQVLQIKPLQPLGVAHNRPTPTNNREADASIHSYCGRSRTVTSMHSHGCIAGQCDEDDDDVVGPHVFSWDSLAAKRVSGGAQVATLPVECYWRESKIRAPRSRGLINEITAQRIDISSLITVTAKLLDQIRTDSVGSKLLNNLPMSKLNVENARELYHCY